jgi:hypothetical protein
MLKFSFFIGIILLLISCNKPDCKQEFVGGIVDVPAIQDTFNQGDLLILDFGATGRDGCSSLKGLNVDENTIGTKNEIWVVSKISSIGCECTMIYPTFDANFNYTCKTKGWNVIKFFNNSIQESTIDSFFVK